MLIQTSDMTLWRWQRSPKSLSLVRSSSVTMGTLLLVARRPRMDAPTRGAPGPCGAASGNPRNGCKSNNADLPAGTSASAVPPKNSDRSALPQPAARHWSQAWSAERCSAGRLSRISHSNRGGEEIAPISCATTKQRSAPAGRHAEHHSSRSIEARATMLEGALGPNDECRWRRPKRRGEM